MKMGLGLAVKIRGIYKITNCFELIFEKYHIVFLKCDAHKQITVFAVILV